MEDIGRRLQAARLAKGLTLQDVEDETRIRKKYLEALETGNLAEIPGEVYAKGFLRAYGNHLELDGEALVEEFKAWKASREHHGDGRGARSAAPVTMAEPAARKEAAHPKAAGEARSASVAGARPASTRPAPIPERPEDRLAERPAERPPRRPATGRPRPAAPSYGARRALVALAVLLPLAGLTWWLMGRPAKPTEAPPPAPKQEEPAAKAPEPAPAPPKPEPPPKPVVTTAGPQGNKLGYEVSVSPVVVELNGFRDGFPWVQVTIDGKEAFVGKLTGPVKYEGKEVIIYAGFTTGVDLTINGESFTEPIKGGPNTITVKGKP